MSSRDTWYQGASWPHSAMPELALYKIKERNHIIYFLILSYAKTRSYYYPIRSL